MSNETYNLNIQVRIEKKVANQYSGECMRTTIEIRNIKASNFLEVCNMLSIFQQQLAERIKKDAS